MAHAAEIYGRRQQMAEEAIAHATAIKVDALALMGEFLRSTEKNKGGGELGVGRKGKECSTEREGHSTPTLAESGITWKESSNAQALAVMREEQPEVFAEVRAGKVSVSKAREVVKAKVACSSKRGKVKDAAPSVPAKWSDVIVEVGRFIERIEGGARSDNLLGTVPTDSLRGSPACATHRGGCLPARSTSEPSRGPEPELSGRGPVEHGRRTDELSASGGASDGIEVCPAQRLKALRQHSSSSHLCLLRASS